MNCETGLFPKWLCKKDSVEFNSYEVTSFFNKNIFYKNVQAAICQNIKNMLRTYPRLREEQFIFHRFTFVNLSARKSELHNVLHEIRVHVKFCSVNTSL